MKTALTDEEFNEVVMKFLAGCRKLLINSKKFHYNLNSSAVALSLALQHSYFSLVFKAYKCLINLNTYMDTTVKCTEHG